MKDNTKIEFVNHASVLITSNEIGILSDPWYFSSTFNQGWRLIYENSIEYVESVISKSTHIYISHEHPDHFSPSFFLDKEVKSILISNNTKILFQETKDKRVVNFLKKNKYEILEISDDKYFSLSDQIKIKIVKFFIHSTGRIFYE